MSWEKEQINKGMDAVRKTLARYRKQNPENKDLILIYEHLDTIYDVLLRLYKRRR